MRYGAAGYYSYKTVTGSTPCTNAVFGDPKPGLTKSCSYANTTSGATTPTPTAPSTVPSTATWTACGSEGYTCSFSGIREVRYGVTGNFFTKVITASTPCTNAVFGDPKPGATKSCSYSSVTR
ncbi:MAG: hypothetical protein EOO64_01060 [Massilia sp.]|nr:MAG: hypothetical protein EOO64_01060 [Massilia sp.]